MTALFIELSDSEATSIAGGGCLETCAPTASVQLSSTETASQSSCLSTAAALSANTCISVKA